MTAKTKPLTVTDLTQAADDLMQADLQVARARAKLHAMIVQLRMQGESASRIAVYAGITRQRVSQVFADARERERMSRLVS